MTILSEGLVCKVCKEPGKKVNTSHRCKECDKEFFAEYREKNKDRLTAYRRKWQKDKKQHLSEYTHRRRVEKLENMTPEQQAEFKAHESFIAMKSAKKLKNDVFMAYGGWVCSCCGEMETSFLTIDHILNNGSQLRREGVHGHSTNFYRWLKKSGYPKDFQVLCMNCQFGKRMNNGVCPHTIQRATVIPEGEVGSSDPKQSGSIITIWDNWNKHEMVMDHDMT